MKDSAWRSTALFPPLSKLAVILRVPAFRTLPLMLMEYWELVFAIVHDEFFDHEITGNITGNIVERVPEDLLK